MGRTYKDKRKVRDYHAINAWQRHSGPMKNKNKIKEKRNWLKDWEEELELDEEELDENNLSKMSKEEV